MIKVDQMIFKPPLGNCLQACVASVMELPLEAVPNFSQYFGREDWYETVAEFLKPYGLYPIELHQPKEGWGNFAPMGYHLITGHSPRGRYHHTIVGYRGKPIHDPYPGGNCELEDVTSYMVFVSLMEKT